MFKYLMLLCLFIVSYPIQAGTSIHNVSPSSSCVTAYEHVNYEGYSWGWCPDNGDVNVGWKNNISSIKIKDGYKAVFCRNDDNICREYSESKSWIGDQVNDKYDFIRVVKSDGYEFDFIISSDTQYDYCVSDTCENISTSSYTSNDWHAKSMKSLAADIGVDKFSGVIINGDLTNTMNRGDVIELERDYGGHPNDIGMVIYPGLGNHDYDNYINDKWCDGWYIDNGGYRAWAQNLCASRLIDWFVGRVKTLPISNIDVNISGHRGKDTVGSLSYSFNKNGWHFVQLNNRPNYSVSFNSYDSWIVRNRYFNIKESHDWLEKDLSINKNKKTILNYHHIVEDDRLGEILDENPQVVAIFVGHLHDRVGSGFISSDDYFHKVNYSFTTPNGRKIPVYYSGSAENNIYLHVTFKSDELTIKPVRSLYGEYKYIGVNDNISVLMGQDKLNEFNRNVREKMNSTDKLVVNTADGSWVRDFYLPQDVENNKSIVFNSNATLSSVIHYNNNSKILRTGDSFKFVTRNGVWVLM